jgi:hypothetical protein
MTDVATMLVGLWAYPNLFERALQANLSKLFKQDEYVFKYIWVIMKECHKNKVNPELWPEIAYNSLLELVNKKDSSVYKKVNELIGPSSFISDDENPATDPQDDLSEIVISKDIGVNQIIWFINKRGPMELWFKWTARRKESGEDLFSADHIAKLLKSFLIERLHPEFIRRVSSPENNISISNLDEILEEYKRTFSVTNLELVSPASRPGWLPQKRIVYPTGIDFLDELSGGGLAPKEVGGILGFINSGKTTLGIQMLLRYGLMEYLKAENDISYVPKYWYFFTYEVEKERLEEILHSQLAAIPLSKIRSINKLEDLSDKLGTELYEVKNPHLFNFIGKLSERERLIRASDIISKLPIRIVDCMASNEEKIEITFIPNTISYEYSKGRQIGGVIIDYAGAMVRLSSALNDSFQFRQTLGACPIFFKKILAKPYNCIVWIFHQYSADTNRLKLKNPDHTNSAEARNFGENLDCCLCMTPVKTLSFSQYVDVPSGRYTRMRCSKLKYTQQPEYQKVLYFDPNIASFVDMSHKVGYDPESDLYFPKLR